MRRPAYALASISVFFSQHLTVWLIFAAAGQQPKLDWRFCVTPLRAIVTLQGASKFLFFLALAYLMIAAWFLAALAFRRAADAGVSEWVAALAIAPVVQLLVMIILCAAPPRRSEPHPRSGFDSDFEEPGWVAAAQGVVAGLGLTLFAVAAGALVFGAYGFGMFVVSPFVIGATTAYFANRKGDVGTERSARLVAGAAALGGIALVMVALEGVVCIVLASPLGLVMALLGGMLGRAIAIKSAPSAKRTLSSFAILPIVFASESLLPPTASFDTCQTVEIDSPAATVWQSIIHMDTIDEPLALPFRLGVAYPLRGKIIGEGVGATRLGEFSTGTAVERVTEWVPNRKLAFTVMKDVPGMREMSPYRHVHAPHVIGYFRTTNTSFELRPLPNGRTELIERTAHELRLDPVLYWLPMARWVVDMNNARVLAHIRHQAERS